MNVFISIMTFISSIAAGASAVIAVIALKKTEKTQKEIKTENRKQSTIEQFNVIQEQVLDKFVNLDRANALKVIDGMDDSDDFRNAYGDYKALIARLDHFAIGVNEGVYDFEIVDKLAGEHLIYLYPKIKPIIDKTNEQLIEDKYYQGYVTLVNDLKIKHPEIEKEYNYGKDS